MAHCFYECEGPPVAGGRELAKASVMLIVGSTAIIITITAWMVYMILTVVYLTIAFKTMSLVRDLLTSPVVARHRRDTAALGSKEGGIGMAKD
jgi:hypothetical protein